MRARSDSECNTEVFRKKRNARSFFARDAKTLVQMFQLRLSPLVRALPRSNLALSHGVRCLGELCIMQKGNDHGSQEESQEEESQEEGLTFFDLIHRD